MKLLNTGSMADALEYLLTYYPARKFRMDGELDGGLSLSLTFDANDWSPEWAYRDVSQHELRKSSNLEKLLCARLSDMIEELIERQDSV